MWRTRPCAAGTFPSSVLTEDGVEQFEAHAVVQWLEASGRGNNADPAAALALHLRPPSPTPEGMRLASALITLRAEGSIDDQNIACKVETGRALAVAGLHPATGGSGLELCSGDMLLEALVACAGPIPSFGRADCPRRYICLWS